MASSVEQPIMDMDIDRVLRIYPIDCILKVWHRHLNLYKMQRVNHHIQELQQRYGSNSEQPYIDQLYRDITDLKFIKTIQLFNGVTATIHLYVIDTDNLCCACLIEPNLSAEIRNDLIHLACEITFTYSKLLSLSIGYIETTSQYVAFGTEYGLGLTPRYHYPMGAVKH